MLDAVVILIDSSIKKKLLYSDGSRVYIRPSQGTMHTQSHIELIRSIQSEWKKTAENLGETGGIRNSEYYILFGYKLNRN